MPAIVAIEGLSKMTEVNSFLSDLDDAVARGTAESRKRALWHATDLLIAGRYSDDEIWTFGEVIGRLADEIEVAARVQLSKRLANFDNAPINIIHKLAFDDSIDVAGPVLRESEQLDDNALIATATTKSQSHLLAISQRKSIGETVTDVLVARGDQEVVNSVASNAGARFSDFGFLHMVKRAEGDSILAEQLGLRRDIPRRVFQQLIAKASEDVKKRLERERPGIVDQIQSSVTDVTRAAVQVRPGIAKLLCRKTAGDDAASARQSEREQHIRICSITQVRRGHDRPVVIVLSTGRRDRTRSGRSQQGNAAGAGQGPRLFVADHNVITVSWRQGSPHHRAGLERPGKGVWPPQPRDIAERSEILSDTQACRGYRVPSRGDCPRLIWAELPIWNGREVSQNECNPIRRSCTRAPRQGCR